MHQPPPADQSTFESQAQYNPQATEDVDEEQHSLEEKKRYAAEIPKRPNYRPKPLRWPFIAAMIALLGLLMVLVIVARTTMPNSDSTATIEPRHMLVVRQDGSSAGQSPSPAPEPSPIPTPVNSAQAPTTETQAGTPSNPTQVLIPSSTNDLPTKSEAQPSATSISPATSALPSVKPSTIQEPNTSQEKPFVASSADKEVTPTTKEDSVKHTTTSSDVVEPKTTSQAVTPSPPSPISSVKDTGSRQGSITSTGDKGDTASTSDMKSTSSRSETAISATTQSASTSSTVSESILDSSTSDLSGHRKAPPIITTTISQSKNTSPTPTPSRDDEIISVITSEFTSTITKPGSTFTYTTEIVTNISSTYTTVIRTTFPGTTGETTFTRVITTSIPRTVTKSAAVSYSLTTLTMPGETQVKTDTISDEKTTYMQTTTKTIAYLSTSTAAVTRPEVVETSFEQVVTTYTSKATFTQPERTSEITSVVVSAVPSTYQSVGTSAAPGQVYVQVGTTEITRVITVPGGNRGSPPTQPPVVQVITSVVDGKVETIVDKPAPQTIVTNDGGVFPIVFTPPAETRVTHVGGQEAQVVITVTPSPEVAFVAVPTTKDGKPTIVIVPSTLNAAAGAFKEVATTINGKATVVNVPVTQEPVLVAVQTTIDGTPTVLLTKSTQSAGFNPISLTLVSEVGGSTGVFVTTDALEAIKTTIDGKETTIVTTPPLRTFTSVSGGTRTTMTIVTTPSGTAPLEFTVITTIGGTLSTIVSTPSPTTFTTTISGSLRTIISTPSPTTYLSTIKPATTVITTTSTPTPTNSADTVITQVEKFAFTNGDYFVGKFLPVILAVIIAVPLRIIDLNAKLYQPFHALAQEGGSLGRNSMTLQFDGWKGFLAPFEVLLQGHPVPFITTLMVLCSSLLAPLATEAIGMKLHGTCKITAIEGCGIQLGVSTMSANALVALLALIIVLLLVLLFSLRSWETGLHANPWSIAGISSLARNADIRSPNIDFITGKKAMMEKRYGLGYFENSLGRDEYGIVCYNDSAESPQGTPAASGAIPADEELTGAYQRDVAKKERKPVPFIALTYWWRIVFAFFLAALFIVILYYHITLGLRTSFKDFMDSQTFGVRFFFAALGVIIIFCWESIFVSIAIISPYHHMARRSQPPEKSILLTRPTNGFYGIYAAVVEGNIILMLTAFMSILAEFLPILFANIPYNLTQTLMSHNVCARVSLSILALMLVTIVASLFIKWPEMPVDPRSIAGALYYVNENKLLDDFEGLSKLDSGEREKRVKELGRRYFYGGINGAHGKRMGVESVEGVEDTAYTGGHWLLPRHEERRAEDDDHGNEEERFLGASRGDEEETEEESQERQGSTNLEPKDQDRDQESLLIESQETQTAQEAEQLR
ncbi:hypothetical protein CkaCkLH20_02045 [Colletotrichum karsti]|uniref:Zonadhesin n=1 Tax=Colletotrichum karsti TaxID=1095194 RepID=A0A9P6IDX6_9PEZI|nr:uncharacterized protein CkaCkLH20_02045 [Colletotrichum karsti]KAF9880091.1 hypothetical protein CkaCkLH20_02045 [Colletotrichum karsti]